MEGRRNGGDLGLWSQYHDHTIRGSSSSSSGYTSAGTIVSTSTGYTSNSSRLSSISSLGLQAVINMDMEYRPTKKYRKGLETSKEKQKEIEEIKILIQEFFGAPSASADCSLKANGGNIGVLDWWLMHLGVGWVLNIADDYVSAGKLELTFDHAWSWIKALAKITHIIGFMASLCPDYDSVGLSAICPEQQQGQQEIETGDKDTIPDPLQFAQFIQETMFKLLVFVDILVENVMNRRTLLPSEVSALISDHSALDGLSALLGVYDALSMALSTIQRSFRCSPPSGGVILDTIVRILSPKQTKAAEAIWSTMKKILMECTEHRCNLSHSLHTQVSSSDVHVDTKFVTRYIRLLGYHYRSVHAIVSEAACLLKDVPQIVFLKPLDSMITEIASCLEETLDNRSQFFTDRGIRFLFLLNNLYFVRQGLLNTPFSHLAFPILYDKVDGYKERYLQESWAPMLSCLLDPTPFCFLKNYSLLPKFENEFQQMYTTQKLWKVPDPELRKTLRKAITEKIIPGYTKFIVDNKVTAPKFSPQDLEAMLQELFEG